MFDRIKNLWKLSQFTPQVEKNEFLAKVDGSEEKVVLKVPQKPTPARFIPRIKEDAIKKITEEQA